MFYNILLSYYHLFTFVLFRVYFNRNKYIIIFQLFNFDYILAVITTTNDTGIDPCCIRRCQGIPRYRAPLPCTRRTMDSTLRVLVPTVGPSD